MVKYNVRDNKVTCVFSINFASCKKTFVGTARCNPTDSFNTEFGKELAYKRAILKLKKYEAQFHKENLSRMKWFKDYEREYKCHESAYQHNKVRVNQLKNEIDQLLNK